MTTATSKPASTSGIIAGWLAFARERSGHRHWRHAELGYDDLAGYADGRTAEACETAGPRAA